MLFDLLIEQYTYLTQDDISFQKSVILAFVCTRAYLMLQ
jgi:hypothetical protein